MIDTTMWQTDVSKRDAEDVQTMASLSVGLAISIWQPPPPPLTPLAALACLHTHTHSNIHTVITSPLPLPTHAHTQCFSLTRKQAWVLGWSENIDLHKSMHCLFLFHNWPLQIHMRLLHVVYVMLHAVAHVSKQIHTPHACTLNHSVSCSMSVFGSGSCKQCYFHIIPYLEGVNYSMVAAIWIFHLRGFSSQQHPHSFLMIVMLPVIVFLQNQKAARNNSRRDYF